MAYKTAIQNPADTSPANQAAESEKRRSEILAQKKEQEKEEARRRTQGESERPCKVVNCKCQNFAQASGSSRCSRAGCDHPESEHK